MEESEIAARLKENVNSGSVQEQVAPQAPVDTTYGQASTAIDYKLDELVYYRMSDYFGDKYKQNDEVAKQQTEYIYKTIADSIGEHDYGFVVARLRELERVIGVAHAVDRRYRVYQWLKLDNMRRSIDAQMGALSNG